MAHRWTLAACVVLIYAGLTQLGGCPSDGGTTGDPNQSTGTDNGTTGTDEGTGGTTNACGTRSMTSVPPAGYYEFAATMSLEAVPSDSALAKVAFKAALCPGSTTSTLPIYQIDENGQIVAMLSLMEQDGQTVFYRQAVTNQQITLVGGCIQSGLSAATQGGTGGTGTTTTSLGGPCGQSHFAITTDGMEISQPEGAYICVLVQSVSACNDCWVENNVWHQRIVTTGYYVAEGSISGVSVYDWAAVCDSDNKYATVSIQTGDRVDFTWTTTIEYRQTTSPQDLGYPEIVYTP